MSVLEKRGIRGDLIALCSFLRRGRGGGGADLSFAVVFGDRTCENASRLQGGRFRPNLRSSSLLRRCSSTRIVSFGRWCLP